VLLRGLMLLTRGCEMNYEAEVQAFGRGLLVVVLGFTTLFLAVGAMVSMVMH
jgi:hypothetical protein